MSSRLPIAALLLLALPACLPECLELHGPFICDPRTVDTRQKLHDLGAYLTLDRGDQLAGGSPGLGTSRSPDRRPLSVSVQAHQVTSHIPSTEGVAPRLDGSRPASAMPVDRSNGMVVTVDATLGLWGGQRNGDARYMGVDVLAGVTQLPPYRGSQLSGGVEAQRILGGGFRLRIMERDPRFPDLAVTWRFRRLPSMSFASGPLESPDGGTVSMTVDGLDPSMVNWRIEAGKTVGRFGVSVGYGSDRLRSSTALRATVRPTAEPALIETEFGDYRFTRRYLGLGATYRVGAVTLGGQVGIIGAAKGAGYSILEGEPSHRTRMDAAVLNHFGRNPGATRRHVSLGVRLGG